jgi:UDP-N-acetylmuramoyl-L-alanyl-D-glutamate--2,6-diaminopimelate ligase
MRSQELFAGIVGAPSGIELEGVSADSKSVRPGSVFVAVTGTARDGHEFIPSAVAAGAAIVVGEKSAPPGLGIPYVRVPDSRKALAILAANLHGNPSRGMLVVGVTGTSGKTTTTYLVESILSAAGRKVGLIGTVTFRFGGKAIPSTHTTPGALELQGLLAEMRSQGCDAVVMEVSSHALKQERVGRIFFDGMVFANLSPEHLDFHPDMEDYFGAKSILFTRAAHEAKEAGKDPFAAINGDDEWGRKLLALLGQDPDAPRFEAFGSGKGLELSLDGIRGRAGDVEVDSALVGRFNAYNLLAAITVTRGMGIPAEAVARGIRSVRSVPGRLEAVPNSRGIRVLVDYAHKSDALHKVLQTLKDAIVEAGSKNRLITVFGCGGDRDRTKRPVMGRIATDLSDRVFITSDNPRTEDPQAIIAEILGGIPGRKNFVVEPDRKRAIHAAIAEAKPGDLVVIAGKGHEDYQILSDGKGGTYKVHFDDREVAAEALKG